MGKIKEYSNGEVTVIWEAEKCIHAAKCVGGLPSVFKPSEKPWIQPETALSDDLVNTIKQCPSGALTYRMGTKNNLTSGGLETKVDVLEDGPLLVHGALNVTDANGNSENKKRTTAFCRCGASQNKPYCDGAHVNAGFKG